MRIAPPHAGQRRRRGRNTRSRSGVRAWRLAIAPSSSTAYPNHQAYQTAHFAAVEKKSLRASEQDRPDVARHRRRWRVWQRYMDGERFVFIDETAATTAMTRLSGWSPKGERLVDAAPAGHWKTTTVVAGLRASGIIAPFVLSGPMTGEAFRAYVEQVLAPELEPGDAVVMDNLSTHKVP